MAYHRLSQKLFHNEMFSFLVKSLQVAGYIMDENQSFELWHFCRCAFFTLTVITASALGFTKTIKTGITPLSISTSCVYLTTSIAYTNVFCRRRRLAVLLAFLQEDMEKLLLKADKREEKMFKEYCRFMYLIRMFISIPMIVAVSILYLEVFYKIVFKGEAVFSVPAETDTRTLSLFEKVFPYGEVHHDFFLSFIFPSCAIFTGILLVPLWPIFISGLMTYVNLKWKIMHKRMSEMDVSKVILEPNESIVYSSLVGDGRQANYLRTRLCKFCVNQQVRIRWWVNFAWNTDLEAATTKFMSQVQELIRIPVFADFIVYSISICFALYALATGNTTKLDLAYMCLYLIVIATALWLYHWNGTLVSDNSLLMSFAIYSSDWYTYSLEVKKMVLQIMAITEDPVEIKVFFITLKISTFIDIIRAAYTYLHLLRSSS